MRNIALKVAYDGTNYSGWQIQKNAITIQEIIQKLLERIVQHSIKIRVAGRTDAGVHAIGQVASFKTTSKMKRDEFKEAMNSMLPSDIRIMGVEDKDDKFHPRYRAIKRWYRYIIYNADVDSPFFRNYALWLRREIDVDLLNMYCRRIIGDHDFTSLAVVEGGRSPVRRIYECEARRKGDFIILDIIANSFLRKMVRSIVGTFLELERNHNKPEEIDRIIISRRRKLAGKTACPYGLYLMKVYY